MNKTRPVFPMFSSIGKGYTLKTLWAEFTYFDFPTWRVTNRPYDYQIDGS